MSDLFRITIPSEIANAGVITLAKLAHQAENTDDDILLLQVSAVVESRSEIEQRIYREAYLYQWKKERGE